MSVERGTSDGSARAPRTVMVVGASSGIGLATVERLLAGGDRVVLVARDADRLRAVAAQVDPGGSRTTTAAADLVDLAAVRAAFAHAVDTFGRVEAVVTTAQPMVYGRVEQVPAEAMRRMSDVAVTGTANLATVALGHFREHGGGSLVVVSSLLAAVAVPAMGAYCAAKWGQLGLVRTLQAEVRHERGLGVSLVLPGAVDTPIYRQAGNYAGRAGSAPPPVVAPDAVARACVARVERPRRLTHVGVGNRAAIAAFRLAPGLYDAVAGPLVDRVVLRGPRQEADPGNVFEPLPGAEAERGGWSRWGRLRDASGRRRWHA